jgi:hypothetical protein
MTASVLNLGRRHPSSVCTRVIMRLAERDLHNVAWLPGGVRESAENHQDPAATLTESRKRFEV